MESIQNTIINKFVSVLVSIFETGFLHRFRSRSLLIRVQNYTFYVDTNKIFCCIV